MLIHAIPFHFTIAYYYDILSPIVKGKILLGLRIAISFGLVALLLLGMRDKLPEIVKAVTRTDLLLFSLAVLIFVLNIIVISYRLQLVFVGEGLKIPFIKVVQLSFVGFFFNNFMPTAVGGDIVKAYYTYTYTNKIGKSFIAVFMDRFIGLISFVIIALFVLLISWGDIGVDVRKIILMFSAFGLLCLVVFLNRKISKWVLIFLSKIGFLKLGEKLSKIYTMIHEYRNKKNIIFAVIAVSLIAQSIYFLTVNILGYSLDVKIGVMNLFLIMPIVSLVSMLPSIGGLGLREGAIVLFFGSIIGREKAFTVSLLLLGVLLIISLIGGIIYIVSPQFRIRRIVDVNIV